MQIPSKKACYHLIYEMEMMDHIVSHSLLVCQVATLLVDHLDLKNIYLNREMIQASALLHDITKTRSFKTKENHAQTGEQLLRDLNYPEVGHIIGQHVVLHEYVFSEPPKEAEIVNYADKRVLHDRVVSLKDRMAYVLKKYGKELIHHERIFRLWKDSERLEKKIFAALSFSPSDLNDLLDPVTLKNELQSYRKVCARLE
ncbi:MAG: HD domain-containing protein [Desulfobacterales bacterium]|nr:MAG: HD domain-containing protein [Desulfobacterales bacterium]UCD89000.1 MAG: HD domain-containing protein [Desulfobacterales bacterium]